MDTKKIFNIFIIAFILSNIYLIYAYYNRYNLQYAATSTNQIDIISEMESFGIDLPVFEENNRDLYSMQANRHDQLEEKAQELENQAGVVSENGSLYTSFLTNPLELEGKDNNTFTEKDYAIIRNYVESEVLFGGQYKFGRFDPSKNSFVFYQIVNEVPVVDGTSEINLFLDNEGNIFSYHQTYAGPMIEQGQVIDLITDQEAVEILYQNNQIPKDSTVQKPMIVYQRVLYLEDLSMYSPTWLVEIDTPTGEELLRVGAIDGQVIQNTEENDLPQPDKEELQEIEEEEDEEEVSDADNQT